MNTVFSDLRSAVWVSALAGIIWGWISMAVNGVTGVFVYESTMMHNLASFTIGGAIFGIVAGSFLVLTRKRLPFKSLIPKAIVLSVAIWVVMRLGGLALSSMHHHRYNSVVPETIQGFILAIVLGLILGIMWKRSAGKVSEAQ